MANSKVSIVGLMPGQTHGIKSDYGSAIDLRFIETDTAPSRVQSIASSSDHVILMTRFIPHDVQNALRKHDGLLFCNGGISAVKLMLDDILTTQAPLQL